jgi:hypothetical protein
MSSNLVVIKRFGQEFHRSRFHGLHRHWDGAETGHENDRPRMPALSERRLQFQPCRLRQAYVQQQASGADVEISVKQLLSRRSPLQNFLPVTTNSAHSFGS